MNLPVSAPVATVQHIVTVIHPITRDEASFTVDTFTNRASDVIREVAHQKVMRGLIGYHIFELLEVSDSF